MTSVRVAGFTPSRNGLHFGNSWPHQPAMTIPLPTGRIRLGDAANGLCGGMAFAVRDFWQAHLPSPRTTTNPGADTALYDFIVRRLVDSFDLPSGVARFMQWQLPFFDRAGAMGRSEWPTMRSELDAGRLVCLGLIRTASFWPGDLGKNHQVLAYGYDLTSVAEVARVTLRLCDPNHHDRDDITMTFALRSGRVCELAYVVGGTPVGRGDHEHTLAAFVQRYTAVLPAPAVAGIPAPV